MNAREKYPATIITSFLLLFAVALVRQDHELWGRLEFRPRKSLLIGTGGIPWQDFLLIDPGDLF